MTIYKITNIINNKVYIGQTINLPSERFHRHMTDANNNILNTKFARAIRKHGSENFVLECIDTAENQDELNLKEQYWIRFYNSITDGYNSTDAIEKCGGNTYQYLDNLDEVKKKLSESKMGGKNPRSQKIKMIDIQTQIEKTFDSMADCARELNLASHMPISRRCRGYTKAPLNNKYQFEYIVE